MRKALLTTAFLAFSASLAIAQQDPDDPGIQDSIIIEDMQIGEPPRSFIVNVLAVTDDPIAYVVVPLSYIAPAGGFVPDDVFFYNNIMGWEYQWHAIEVDSHRILIRAISDTAYMNTVGQRLLVAGLHFQNNAAPPQNMTIDTTWDSGLQSSVALKTYEDTSTITPAFLRGTVYFLPQSAEDGERREAQTSPLGYPNPFGPSGFGIWFDLPSDQEIEIGVFNILGQQVWGTWRYFMKGNHEIRWQAVDYNGNHVPGGIYFYRIETDEGITSGKLTFLK